MQPPPLSCLDRGLRSVCSVSYPVLFSFVYLRTTATLTTNTQTSANMNTDFPRCHLFLGLLNGVLDLGLHELRRHFWGFEIFSVVYCCYVFSIFCCGGNLEWRGGLEVVSFRWNFVAATDRRLLLRWSEGFIGNRKATYRGSVSISLLFFILFPFEILLLFSFPSISVFARANSTILLWNSSIHNGDKLWSFGVYSLSMHQVAKPLTIPRFYIRSHLVINL